MVRSNSIFLFAEHLYNGKNQVRSERHAFYRKLSETFTSYFSYRVPDTVSEITLDLHKILSN